MKSLLGSALAFVVVGGSALPAFAADDDPIATHTIALDEATKGLKGTGSLEAKLEIDQKGKPLGTLVCELFEEKAPKTVANFVGLARGVRPFKDTKSGAWVKRPFYDGLTFHRVVPGYLIQGGDPLGNSNGTPGYRFDDEIVADLSFDKPAVLAMASMGPGTNGSQFFITEVPATDLTGKHSVFGTCAPADLVAKIANVPTGAHKAPIDPVVLKKVTIQRRAAAAPAKAPTKKPAK